MGDGLIERAVAMAARRTNHEAFDWCSDGWRSYPTILTQQYQVPQPTGRRGRPPLRVPEALRLTQTVKLRDRHGRVRAIEQRAALGTPIDRPATVHIERLHGCLRDRLNAFTRKTHAFAKCRATWNALFHLQLFEHNWMRPQRALHQQTPAMVLGLATAPWSWIQFLRTPLHATS